MADLKKIVAGSIFAGGITIAGVAYTGGASIDNMKEMAAGLQDRIEQAISDNTFLQDEYNSLKTEYIEDTDAANAKIQELNNTVVSMNEQIKTLESQKDTTAEQEELQTEINRLESELQQANSDIAELETYIQQIETDTQYTAVDREQITTNTAGLNALISKEALLYDDVQAQTMAEHAAALSEALSAEYGTIEITEVVLYNYSGSTDYLAYEATPESAAGLTALSEAGSYLSGEIGTLKSSINGTANLYFVVEGETTHSAYLRYEGSSTTAGN